VPHKWKIKIPLNAIMRKRERIVEKRYREKNLKLFKRAKELRVLKLLSAKIEITPPPSFKRVKDIMGSSEISKLSEAK
jgi:hypothetical protein